MTDPHGPPPVSPRVKFILIAALVLLPIGASVYLKVTTGKWTMDRPTAARSSGGGSGSAVDAAYALCQAMNSTGLVSECEVQGWGKTVDVRMDTTAAEARTVCAGSASQAASYGTAMRRDGWRLRVFSPFSGDHPLATCSL